MHTIDQWLAPSSALYEYIQFMPIHLKQKLYMKVYPAQTTIHQKGDILTRFGIICKGECRTINVYEKGDVFMIYQNKAISFLGEVTLMAESQRSSVTIETVTECVVLYLSIDAFREWIQVDIHFLNKLCKNIASNLYFAAYKTGARLFYSASDFLLTEVLQYAEQNGIATRTHILIDKSRQQISEQ